MDEVLGMDQGSKTPRQMKKRKCEPRDLGPRDCSQLRYGREPNVAGTHVWEWLVEGLSSRNEGIIDR